VCCVFYIQCRCVVSALLERRSCHLILRGGTEELTSFLIKRLLEFLKKNLKKTRASRIRAGGGEW
jgi:hypothetical protein